MAYSIDALTEDCYPGTTCLINKLGIQDEEKLAETEAAIVLGKASLLDQQPMAGAFDFAHYKSIHHFLFCDLYNWAGQIRTINVSKKGTVFVPAAEIPSCADACFSRLAAFICQVHIIVSRLTPLQKRSNNTHVCFLCRQKHTRVLLFV